MGYIPSERVAEGLSLASTGLWIEGLQDRRIAIIAKIPETVIKALHRGAPASLFVGVVDGDWLRFLCLGLRVDDEPEHPFTVTMPATSPQENAMLREILSFGSTTLHCMNELDHPALSADCKLESPIARYAAKTIEASTHWLLTLDSCTEITPVELGRNLNLALDNFGKWIYGDRVANLGEGNATLPVEIPLALDLWPRQTIIHASSTLQEAFSLEDEAEGEKLERGVLSIVELLYPERAYRSPQIPRSSRTRELTDVLGFNDDWLCVIQVKALAVLGVADRRSSERRASAVAKDIAKGLKQLAGAMRQIRAGVPICALNGVAINLPNRNAPAHAILILSEMYFSVDWKAVAAEVNAATDKAEMTLFHVFDLRELASLANSSKATDKFNQALLQRWVHVKMKGTAYGRARPRNASDPAPEEDLAVEDGPSGTPPAPR